MPNKQTINFLSLIKDIRFWIILCFLFRLYGVTFPPLDMSHSWRQVTGSMVARNFYEIDSNILYPRIDFAGDKTGITRTEFPLLNYLMYLLSIPFGFEAWYGRLINLIVSSLGIWYFYRLCRYFLTEKQSFISSFFLLISSWFIFSRKIMPDTFSVSLVIIGVYYAYCFMNDGKKKNIILYVFITSLGLLSKIPSALILGFLFFPLVYKVFPIKRKYILVFFSILSAIPAIIWYYYWVPHLNETYEFIHYYMGVSFREGFFQLINNTGDLFKRFYFEPLKYTGFLLSVLGMFFVFMKKNKPVLLVFTAQLILLILFMLKSGFAFTHHSYYILPFVPMICICAAMGIDFFKNKKIQFAIILLITIENIGNHLHDFRIKDSLKYKLSLENILDRYSDKEDLIALNCGQNPSTFYFAHRKGWIVDNEELISPEFINNLYSKNCKFIILDKSQPSLNASIHNSVNIYEDEHFLIFQPILQTNNLSQ